MKVAVVGCGALGSYYGARLCLTGHDTHFLLRSDYEVVRRQGLRIRSVNGDFTVHPHCAAGPSQIGVADLVLIGLKTTANHRFPELLTPLVGPDTLVVTLQNGLGNEEQLARLFGPANILCGLCFVCLNRLEPGLIHHMAHGKIVLGEYQRKPMQRTHHLAALFNQAGIPCVVTDDLAKAHWEKLVWNIPFNGLGVAGVTGYACLAGLESIPEKLGPTLPSDVLLADPRWESLLRELMREVIGAARGQGHLLAESLEEENISRTRIMGAYKASTLLDFEKGLPLETGSLFLEPLRQAHAAGVPTPRLARLGEVLVALEQRRALRKDG